jgi:hypothetical protein
MKNPGHEVCDRDSSSESDRSHPEASAVSESSLDEHTSTQSGNYLSPTTLSIIIISVSFLLRHRHWDTA